MWSTSARSWTSRPRCYARTGTSPGSATSRSRCALRARGGSAPPAAEGGVRGKAPAPGRSGRWHDPADPPLQPFGTVLGDPVAILDEVTAAGGTGRFRVPRADRLEQVAVRPDGTESGLPVGDDLRVQGLPDPAEGRPGHDQ